MGHYSDVYILVPLSFVGANAGLKNGFQVLMSSLYQAYDLCLFDGSVFDAISGLFHRLFFYFGTESCAIVRSNGVWDIRVSGETFYDRLCVEPAHWDRKQVP